MHRGKEYEYVVVDDDRGTVHTKPLHPRSEAAEAIKVYKVATENMVQMKLREVMTDDHEEWIRPPYQPAPNKLARRSISVLNKTTPIALPRFLWAEAFSDAWYVHNRAPTKALSSAYGRRSILAWTEGVHLKC